VTSGRPDGTAERQPLGDKRPHRGGWVPAEPGRRRWRL